MTRKISLLLFLLPLCLFAQEKDSIGKWDYHLNVGTAFSTGFGASTAYTNINPSIAYHPSNQFTIKAGFMALNSIDLNHFYAQDYRSLAPRRNSSTAVGARVEVQYDISDRLWIAGSVFHVGGQTILPGGFYYYGLVPAGTTMDMNATGVSAHLHYRLRNHSSIDFHMTYIHDREGSLAPLLYDSYYYGHPCGYGFGYGNSILDW